MKAKNGATDNQGERPGLFYIIRLTMADQYQHSGERYFDRNFEVPIDIAHYQLQEQVNEKYNINGMRMSYEFEKDKQVLIDSDYILKEAFKSAKAQGQQNKDSK